MEFKIVFARYNWPRVAKIFKFGQCNRHAFFCSATDIFLENLTLEGASKRESTLLKYFENHYHKTVGLHPTRNELQYNYDRKTYGNVLQMNNIPELVNYLETDRKIYENVPNNKINYLLVYFAKSGNINGVKAVQFIVKKYNIVHFESQSGYKHYLAEALWIDGKIEDSLKLFLVVYENSQLQDKVKLMIICLFRLLITQHSEGKLCKTVKVIEQFSAEKQDHVILAYLWRTLFQSTWFSDHQMAQKLLEKHSYLLPLIQWMIPAMGKELLKEHKVEDFYRLIQLALENQLKTFATILVQLLFDYYYIHQNIERCSAVVKYSSNLDYPLTEHQQRMYINLLLKSKNAVSSKLNIKKPQKLNYKF